MATTAQVNAFIELIAPSVQKLCKSHGWGIPSAIIAQAGLESAWGTSGLSKTCFNYFGMKWKEGCGCNYKEYKTGEQRADGTRYTVTAKFRKYTSVEDGLNGYFKFIESYSRYKPVIASKTYTEYATQLKACGWATSVNYTNNIIKTLTAHNLQKYDGDNKMMEIAVPTLKQKKSYDKKVKVLQQNLIDLAEQKQIKADGYFGEATAQALKNVQAFCGLTVDGVYGPKTQALFKKLAEQKGYTAI